MKIEAKEILISLLGIIGALIISLLFENKINLKGFSFQDIIILIIIFTAVFVYVIYKRIGEIEGDIEDTKKDYKELDERLKIQKQLINIEARIIALEKDKNGKKSSPANMIIDILKIIVITIVGFIIIKILISTF